MRAILRRTGRWPAYHDAAAEVANALTRAEAEGAPKPQPEARERRDLA